MLGSDDTIVNADGDYNGVFEYSGGELYYGASGYNPVKGLYRFTSSEVTGAIGAGELVLDVDHKFGATTTNHVGALAFGNGTDLWKDDPFSTNLLLFDRSNGGVSTIGTAGSGSTLGQLDFAANSLFVNVTDFNTSRSSIFKVSVPEPSTAAILFAGLALFLRRRRPFPCAAPSSASAFSPN
ncbi:MAG: PEP-CTERM sorting domain-containing protein [Chthoniobacteraceae bacterium]